MKRAILITLLILTLLIFPASALTEWSYSSATASSYYSDRVPGNLIDHSLVTIWDGFNLNAYNSWVQIDYGAGNTHPVSYYAIYGNANPGSYFTDWRFLGSNDGSTFTLLDIRNAQTAGATATWTNNTVTYTGNVTAFRYYRIAFYAFVGGEPVLGEVSLLGSTTDTSPPASITNLVGNTTANCQNITWTWTNPTDSDYAYLYTKENNIWISNQTNSTTSLTRAGLPAATNYTLSTKTVDLLGNINATWVNTTVTSNTCPTPTSTPTPTATATSAPTAIPTWQPIMNPSTEHHTGPWQIVQDNWWVPVLVASILIILGRR